MRRKPSPQMIVEIPRLAARRGDSLAINGVCLTVAVRSRSLFTFDLLAETLRSTTFGSHRPGDRVNVEPALKVGDPLGGHLVLGHVDGVGRVVARRSSPSGLALTMRAPLGIRRYLAPKGAIAVDGVSLTVGPRIARGRFTVHLIPETVAQTTLGARRPGDSVNLEVDPIARYAAAAMASAG